MAVVDHIKHYTYDDYKKWEGDWELYEGYPVAMSPAPMIRHHPQPYRLSNIKEVQKTYTILKR